MKTLVELIFVLSFFSEGMGLFYQSSGLAFLFTSNQGEEVKINGQGLCFYDTVSSTTQAQSNDLVTFLAGLPLLAISAQMAWGGSLRGRLILTSTLRFSSLNMVSFQDNNLHL